MEIFELVVTAPSDEMRHAWVDVLCGSLTELVGGVSIYEGQGGYKSEVGVLVFEPHTKILAYCQDMKAREVFNFMSTHIRLYKENCQQKAVLVVLNGELYVFTEVPSSLPLD